jgi:protein TonB
MKPTTVLFTVILLATGLISCITKDKPNVYISDDVLPEIQVKEEKVELPPPPPDSTQRPLQRIVDPVSGPVIIENSVHTIGCDIIPHPILEEADLPKAAKADLVKVYSKPIICEGTRDDGSVIPPPVENEFSDTMVWRRVEIEAEYPGGAAAWQRFLNKNLRYPQEAIDNEIFGSVVVQFVVDKEGNVSDVEAVSGPEVLRAEMIRVIKESGKWTPAVQGGRQVRSLKKQPFIICLQAEE